MNAIKRIFKSTYFVLVFIFIGAGFCSLGLASNGRTKLTPKPISSSDRYIPTIDFAQYALHQGNARSGNLVEGFIPLYPADPKNLLFTDIRFYNPNGTPMEGNIDLGFRRLFDQNTQQIGLYAGYDRYRSDSRRYYNQAHLGLEYWYQRFFIGANGYLPFGTKVYDNNTLNSAFLVPTDTSYRYNIAFEAGKERALPGVDAEIGYDITRNLTLYGGGYYFDHSDASSILGPKFRATYTIYRAQSHRILTYFDRIRLEGLISHDSIRGTSWLAGIRFTFGLSNRSNPTSGLARHMTDPIRRDLNGVSEGYNAASQTYKINGTAAQVDIVSDISGRTIDDAVSGDADVIGVQGFQTAGGELNITDKDLTVTGGQYNFTTDGQPYRIANVGDNGQLTSAGNDNNLFSLADTTGNHTFTLEHLTLNSLDDTAWALQTDGNTFGKIMVDYVNSNMPFDFILTAVDATGSVKFTNNKLNLQNSEAVDGNVSAFAGVVFDTDTTSEKMTIAGFSDNTINIINRTFDALDVIGLYVGESGTVADFTQGIVRNTVLVTGAENADYYGFCFSGNTVEGNINNNILSASNNTGGSGYALFVDYASIINGNMSGNTFTASNNSGNGFGLNFNGILTITGNFSENNLTSSNNGSYGNAFRTGAGDITINGNVIGNNLTASQNGVNGAGISIAQALTINGSFSRNNLLSNNNQVDGLAFNSGNSLTVNGNISGNTFMASNNSGEGLGLNLNGIVTITGNFSENNLTSSNNGSYGNAIKTGAGDITINGNVIGNNLTASQNGVNGAGISIADTLTINGSFSRNNLLSNNNQVDGLAFNSGNSLTVSGNISGNTFMASNNGNSGVAFKLKGNAMILGNITNNVLKANGNVANNSGLYFEALSTGEVITFERRLVGNSFLINGSLTGDYGILLDTSLGGIINFNGNSSETELSTSNNGVSINSNEGTGSINYNG